MHLSRDGYVIYLTLIFYQILISYSIMLYLIAVTIINMKNFEVAWHILNIYHLTIC
jgi:hypothetical protein